MHLSHCRSSKTRLIALTAATSAVLAFSAQAHNSHHHGHGISQSGEQKNMLRVGHVDLQGRSAYQPNVITYPDGRTIAFVGTHGGTLPNPLNGNTPERNGTMIIDVTNPRRPKEVYHIPNLQGGTDQMARMCLGSVLTGNPSNRNVYLMRNFGSGYETWDVTDVRNPQLLASFYGPSGTPGDVGSTHKHWWECTTGIAYLPGRPAGWRQRGIMIVDWRDPTNPPIYLRTFGLPGAQPSGTGDTPPSPHGPISVEDAFPDKDRIYIAYGTSSNGVLQIMNREELLPAPYGTYLGDSSPDDPTDDEMTSAQVSRLDMSPDQGGHTSMPVFGLVPRSYQDFTEYKTRDIVLFASESTSNQCVEAPHWSFIVDITTETKPWNLSTMWVDPRAGEKYPRGNYCTRGARFGVHSSEENFNNPYYGKLTFLAYFTGGVRAWDISEPQAPREVAFYVPENNDNTVEQCATHPDGQEICKISYMTNNLEVDDRGYIYIVDRSGSGMDILKLTESATKSKRHGHDDDDDHGRKDD